MTRNERMSAYPTNCRVRLSELGMARGIHRNTKLGGVTGIVTGHGEVNDTLYVLRDGTKHPRDFHWSAWERIVELPLDDRSVEEHW